MKESSLKNKASDRSPVNIYVVTVNYNSADSLLRLLSSLEKLNFDLNFLKVLIIDSSSELNDQKLENINLNYEIIYLPENRGFAYAANIGLKIGSNQGLATNNKFYLWLLNPDIEVHPASLSELLNVADPESIYGSTVTNNGFEPTSTIWGVGGFIDKDLNPDMGHCSKLLSSLPTEVFECDYIPGCSMFIPSTLCLSKINYLPEEYFLYFEETDWCINLKKMGIKMKIAPRSLVFHPGEPEKMSEPFRVYFYNRNSLLFKLKNLTSNTTKLKLAISILLKLPSLAWLILKEKDPNMKQTFKAHFFAQLDALRIYTCMALHIKNFGYGSSSARLKFFKTTHPFLN